MRARYVIRDMANGEAKAWRQAEWKLRGDRTHPNNKRDLADAIATLPDPRNRQEPTVPDPKGRRFAIEVHASGDWGDHPPVRDTGYEFASVAEASAEAVREMWRQYCLGESRRDIGAYVISNDAETTDDGDPSVYELLTLP